MADASDSKSDDGNIVWVQVPPSAVFWKTACKMAVFPCLDLQNSLILKEILQPSQVSQSVAECHRKTWSDCRKNSQSAVKTAVKNPRQVTGKLNKKRPRPNYDRGIFISACLFISEESYMKKMKRKIYHLGVLGKWLVPVQTERQIILNTS